MYVINWASSLSCNFVLSCHCPLISLLSAGISASRGVDIKQLSLLLLLLLLYISLYCLHCAMFSAPLFCPLPSSSLLLSLPLPTHPIESHGCVPRDLFYSRFLPVKRVMPLSSSCLLMGKVGSLSIILKRVRSRPALNVKCTSAVI